MTPTSSDRPDMATIFAMMLQYLEVVDKEARADRAELRAAEKRELEAKAAKIALENTKIVQMNDEARERADLAMEAAMAAMVIGIVSGNASAGGAWTITVPQSTEVGKRSDQIQRQILEIEREIDKEAQRVAEARDAADASRKRKQAIRDSIQKLLDKVRSMNPDI